MVSMCELSVMIPESDYPWAGSSQRAFLFFHLDHLILDSTSTVEISQMESFSKLSILVVLGISCR